jgi:Protein of unknown function (DUF4012)
MKHRAQPRHVRVPILGSVPVGLLLAVSCVVGMAFAAFVVTLVPLWMAHHDAKTAADELQQANKALSAGRTGDAQAALTSARDHVDGAQGHVNGLAADMWSHLPVLGPAVVDGRHLVAALDQATTAAAIGVDMVAHATAPGSELIQGNQVNVHEVEQMSSRLHRIEPHLRDAQAEIDRVDGDGLVVGSKINELKDEAATQLRTAEVSYQQLKPLLDRLPAVLGAKGPQTYLLTIMNPAELRFSGGATLQMATIRFDDGTITFGPSQSVVDVDRAKPFLNWPAVPGNLFHPPGPRRLTAATYSPWWQVSGEELLRAWQAQTGQRCQGLIAVDLQALAELFRITGPMQVSGYGELNADNLVRTLAGSYDRFQDHYQRHLLNNSLVPAFKQKFISGGDFVQKGRSLLQAAEGRHFAMYFRAPRSQRAFAEAGFAGDLSRTRHDYLGVFSQNLNGSKADYWQERHVSTTVTLAADGSADEVLAVLVKNPSPPYLEQPPDPRSGYGTRWLGAYLGIFFPPGTQLGSVTAGGKLLPRAALEQNSTSVKGVLDRPVLRRSLLLGPHRSRKLTVSYSVPHAASVQSDGDLTYRIDMDPQDLVQPQSNTVALRIPSGYHFGKLPAGWVLTDSHTATLVVPQLTVSSSWTVPVVKD